MFWQIRCETTPITIHDIQCDQNICDNQPDRSPPSKYPLKVSPFSHLHMTIWSNWPLSGRYNPVYETSCCTASKYLPKMEIPLRNTKQVSKLAGLKQTQRMSLFCWNATREQHYIGNFKNSSPIILPLFPIPGLKWFKYVSYLYLNICLV